MAACLFETAVCGKKGLNFGLSFSRLAESPAQSVPLGTPTGVLHNLKGGGRKAEFSRLVIRCPVGGDGQGGEDPLAAFFAYFLSHHRK